MLRKKGLARTQMRTKQVKRRWQHARAKVDGESCRDCGHAFFFPPEAAHLVPRRFDEEKTGPKGGKYLYVHPDNIVALCRSCHRAFDAGELSLLGKLTMRELRHVVSILGKHRARRRLSGGTT